MQQEGDSIASSLFSEIGEQVERVEELFPSVEVVDVLGGLIESKQKAEPICPEDLAWVDSCLVADPELSMESWVSLKEALLDSIAAFATSYEHNNAAGGVDEDGAGNDRHMIPDQGDTVLIRALHLDENGAGIDEHMEVGEKQEIVGGQEEAGDVRAEVNRIRGDHDSDDDAEIKVVGTKKEFESRESIFRVWDLREEEHHELIPELQRAVADLRVAEEEEDHFITELSRAVAESIIKEKQRLQTNEASIADDRKLDELISSMGDLSIKPLP